MTCLVEECSVSVALKRGMCNRHYLRWWKHGDPTILKPRGGVQGPRPTGALSAQWKGDECGYTAAHSRIRKSLGKASGLLCSCGAQARQWAYNRQDPDERTEVSPKGRLMPYSTSERFYEPKCLPCHYDMDHRQTIETKA